MTVSVYRGDDKNRLHLVEEVKPGKQITLKWKAGEAIFFETPTMFRDRTITQAGFFLFTNEYGIEFVPANSY